MSDAQNRPEVLEANRKAKKGKQRSEKTIKNMEMAQQKRYEDPKEHDKQSEIGKRPEVIEAKRLKMSGENNPSSKLTNIQREEIKTKWLSGKYTRKQLYKEYDTVSNTRIDQIIRSIMEKAGLTPWKDENGKRIAWNKGKTKLSDIQIEEIKIKWLTGASINELHKEYNFVTIRNIYKTVQKIKQELEPYETKNDPISYA